jgi:hypothetical protein
MDYRESSKGVNMKVKMTVDEALEFADEWMQGMSFYEGSQGWRVVCAILAAEVRRLNEYVKGNNHVA